MADIIYQIERGIGRSRQSVEQGFLSAVELYEIRMIRNKKKIETFIY